MPIASSGLSNAFPALASTRSSTTAERIAAKQIVIGSRSQNKVESFGFQW